MEIRSREEWGNCRYLRTQMDVEELGTVEITEVIQYIKEDIGEPCEVVVYSSIVVPKGKIDTEEEKEYYEKKIYEFLDKELPDRYLVRIFN